MAAAGSVAAGFEAVSAAFAENFARRGEAGAAFGQGAPVEARYSCL
jgi:hypothetical protein